MATLEQEAFLPNLNPADKWDSNNLWEDFSAQYDKGEGAISFYSYGVLVIEADFAVCKDEAGRKIAFIDDIVQKPVTEDPEIIVDEESQLKSAFKTVFYGLQLDSEIKAINTAPSNLETFFTILRTGVPEGWRRVIVDSDDCATTDAYQAAAWKRENRSLTIRYDRQPELRPVELAMDKVIRVVSVPEFEPPDIAA